jgi:hypothetical protein
MSHRGFVRGGTRGGFRNEPRGFVLGGTRGSSSNEGFLSGGIRGNEPRGRFGRIPSRGSC